MDEYPTTDIAVEDVQSPRSDPPALALARGRHGVEKVIRIRQNGVEQLFSAQLECFVDLGPRQKGAHMSRFEEVVNDAIGEVILGETAFRAETLAQHIAEKVRDRQDAQTAEVTIPPATRSTSRRRCRASRRRRSTRCTAPPSPDPRARGG